MRLAGAADAAVRGWALFAGAFLAVSGGLALAGRGGVPWLVDLRVLGTAPAGAAGVAGGLAISAWALRPSRHRLLRRGAAGVALLAAGAAAWNAVVVRRLAADGTVGAGALPLSAVTALLFLAVACAAWRDGRAAATARAAADGEPTPRRRRVPVLPAAALWAVLFPVAQIASFGRSDYRRSADLIVVFGARAYADGTASRTLADRVRTGCALWREGRAPVLFLSGGPGDGAVHETDAMRRVALAEGVPDAAIVLDRDGVNTRATVDGAARSLRRRRGGRVLAVSHAYHLPRVKLLFEDAGVAAFTVPARETRFVAKTPWFVAREVAAWWVAWAGAVRG